MKQKVSLREMLSKKSAFSVEEKAISFLIKKEKGYISLIEIYKDDGNYHLCISEDICLLSLGKNSTTIEDLYYESLIEEEEKDISLEKIKKIIGKDISEKFEADIINPLNYFEEVYMFALDEEEKMKAVCF